MANRLQKRKLKLFEENPHCCYCGCELILVSTKVRGEKQPDNLATIEHFISKLETGRLDPNDGKTPRTGLACFRCNNLANKIIQSCVPVEILRELSYNGHTR